MLDTAGYRRSGEGKEIPLDAWHHFAKDSTGHHASRCVTVELHTALTDHPGHLLPGLGTASPLQAVALSSRMMVRTFAIEPLSAYLCVHGALSGWRRLKWLADLAGLMRIMDADEIVHLHHVARTLGGRAATQGLALAARLLGTPLPPAVAEAMATDRWTRWLVSRAERLLTDPTGFDNPG